MFHFSNYGQFGMPLQRYADLNGYVPEQGDKLQDFVFPTGWFDSEDEDFNQEDWEGFIEAAVEATTVAERKLQDWRYKQENYH